MRENKKNMSRNDANLANQCVRKKHNGEEEINEFGHSELHRAVINNDEKLIRR